MSPRALAILGRAIAYLKVIGPKMAMACSSGAKSNEPRRFLRRPSPRPS